MASTALLTDRYELTMLDTTLADGTAGRRTVFEVFARALPPGRRYGVAAGLGRVVDAIDAFRFDAATLDHLADERIVSDTTLAWLAGFRFSGRIDAYREGEVLLPGSPVLTLEASFAEAILLETVVLSILNHDSAIAAAAARMVQAAGGRDLLEFGTRRAHEDAAVAAARAAALVGFAGTSNLEAGRRHGIPTHGTAGHAVTLLHDDEASAFRGQVAALGAGTTLLVDTYDVERGIATALEVAGPGLGAIRIDSGDLGTLATAARAQLDAAGATATRIVLSGDLDEHRIAALAAAPVDAFGVGTSVVTGSGAPTAGFVYKLVEREAADGTMVEVAKRAGGKSTVGGRKSAHRRLVDGRAVAEVLRRPSSPGFGQERDDERALQVPVIVDGECVHRPTLDEARDHHRRAMAELPDAAHDLAAGPACLPTVLLDAAAVPVATAVTA
jgi:nicotinate phosphoribosyltransferase